MCEMKIFVLFFFLFAGSLCKSQTFIGNTKEEIISINNKLRNKQTYSNNDTIISTLSFDDNKFSITHNYNFTNDNRCIGYQMVTNKKSVKDSLMNDILKKYPIKLSENSWLQKANGKEFVWRVDGKDDLYVISTESRH
jgi:hypothetical protein